MIDIVTSLGASLKKKTTIKLHYDPQNDDIFYYFSSVGESIDILKLNRWSNKISDKKNRPIAIFNFNPLKSYVTLPHNNYTSEKISIEGDNDFFKINLYDTGSTISVYIYDHRI